MPFGLANAPATFQHMINDVLRDYLDIFVVAYLDDLLIFSTNKDEHERHVKLVLTCLREAGLFAKLEKCLFNQNHVDFLGYIISDKGITMDPAKIRTILEWKTPESVRDVQCFLGFANFYRCFIKGFSHLTLALTRLTHKGPPNAPFVWNSAAQQSFDTLKSTFTSAPILTHADPTQPFVLETDASDYALGAILSQKVAHSSKIHNR